MPQSTPAAIQQHPFTRAPHRTVLTLSIPVLLSMVAEPLTGLVDTAFVARLGAESLAALGVGTAVLSATFWIFNFLGIGTQTEVAQAMGRERTERAARFVGLALIIGVVIGLGLIIIGWFGVPWSARALGASGLVAAQAEEYMYIRLFGAPAVLATLAAFGALRGVQDMRTPLWIAVTINVINIGLDAVLVVGYGPIPALGIAGVAAASVTAQWIGALWAVTAVLKRFGRPAQLRLSEAGQLIRIGGDLFVRTALLNAFLLIATRVATQIGPESGAANQAVRQFWVFTALGLDALAITAQSLVGYFVGAGQMNWAKRVAAVTSQWAFTLGVLLSIGMWLGQDAIADLLVPASALSVFGSAWIIATLVQPINAMAFVTDGIHWGTGDFRYLRNVMILSSVIAGGALLLIDTNGQNPLTWVWLITGLWIAVRACFGIARVWPGVGDSPFRVKKAHEFGKVVE